MKLTKTIEAAATPVLVHLAIPVVKTVAVIVHDFIIAGVSDSWYDDSMDYLERNCFKCEKSLEPVVEPDDNSPDHINVPPNDATCWNSVGNYGSKVFDSFGRKKLEMFVCDECLEKHKSLVYRYDYVVKNEISNVRKFGE